MMHHIFLGVAATPSPGSIISPPAADSCDPDIEDPYYQMLAEFEKYGKLAAALARAPEWDQPPSSTAAEVMASSIPDEDGAESVAVQALLEGNDEDVRDAFVRGLKLGLGEDVRKLQL